MASDERTTTRPALSPKSIEAAQPRDRDYELSDPGAPGLFLRVTKRGKDGRSGGAKVFRWYVNSIGRRITIGRWTRTSRGGAASGYVTLGEAHTCLERLKEAHRAGRLDEEVAKLCPARDVRSTAVPSSLTVGELAPDFFAYVERRRKRPEQARRPVERDILPAIGDRPVSSITTVDCRKIVESVVARGSRTQAGVVLGVLKQLFNFACRRGDIATNPTAPLVDGGEALGVVKNTCARFLSPEEIGAFWKALDAYKGMTPTVRIGLRLLLLTGVRSGELLRAEWGEVDFDAATWTIPVAHQKLTRRQEQRARPWVVPLSTTALALFQELQALAKSLRSPYVMASFHGAGEHLTEKSLIHAMRRLFVGKDALLASFAEPRPTPHDLRRTMRTHLGDKLAVPFHVAERCLNHSLGKVADIYDRGDYVNERRDALEKWSAYVERLVAPQGSNVAFLPAARP